MSLLLDGASLDKGAELDALAAMPADVRVSPFGIADGSRFVDVFAG